jgi:hypothetical protein
MVGRGGGEVGIISGVMGAQGTYRLLRYMGH